jgi:hypothetical protein
VHGSTQLAVDEATGTISRERYLPFCQRRGTDDLPFAGRGFLGKTEDASTSLTCLGDRSCDPTIARLISTDPELDLRTPKGPTPTPAPPTTPSTCPTRRPPHRHRKSDATIAETHHASGKKKTARE